MNDVPKEREQKLGPDRIANGCDIIKAEILFWNFSERRPSFIRQLVRRHLH
jgi:hypothetical protein